MRFHNKFCCLPVGLHYDRCDWLVVNYLHTKKQRKRKNSIKLSLSTEKALAMASIGVKYHERVIKISIYAMQHCFRHAKCNESCAAGQTISFISLSDLKSTTISMKKRHLEGSLAAVLLSLCHCEVLHATCAQLK